MKLNGDLRKNLARVISGMQTLSDRISSLSPAQRALLELRLQKNRSQTQQIIPTRPVAEHYPLSWDQERLWFIQQLDPSSSAYNIYSVRRFKGKVDVGLLTRCLNEVVRRHEILRTSFVTEESRPVQVIAPQLEVRIPFVDLRALPFGEREAEAERVVTEQLKRPFDLTCTPIFRTALVCVDDDDYVCPTVFHHIVIDWISFQLFERELARLYSAFAECKSSPLRELPIQYADFAVWQRAWVDDQAGRDHLDYWKNKLEGVPLVLDLPTDRPRPPLVRPLGVRQPLVLSKAHSDAVRVLAQQEGVTMFICLLAVFKLLLFRHTGQEQIIVGSPAAYRKGNTEELLGYFLNHLAFCTDLSGDPTFRELLRRVRQTALEAYTHQDLPFGKLVETLQPQRALSRTPITQVVFLFLNTHQQDELKFPGFEVLPYWADSGAVDFDMTFSLWDEAAGLHGWLEYNTDLYNATTILRMTEHFRNLVAAVTTNPDLRVSQLDMVTAVESHQVLWEWSQATSVDETSRTLVQLFEAQVKASPEAVAVIDRDTQITYGELNKRANLLASHLHQLGVGPETVVGVLMQPSADALIGLIAVLKAGGVYLPLDPAHPHTRHTFLLSDANAAVLLTQKPGEFELPAHCSQLIYTTDQFISTGEPELDPVGRVCGQNLAYIVYTSGSTGEPKGVSVTHEAAARHLAIACKVYRMQPADHVLQFASVSTDVAIEQVFTALLAGATLVLRRDELWSVAELLQIVRERKLTVLDLPPAYWQELMNDIDHDTAHDLARQLRLVIAGGDVMPPAAASRWQHTPLRSVRLLNAYGPTEATITALKYELSPSHVTAPKQRIPIGRPLTGRTVYILDERGQPAPIGVIGELHIGGPLLARGYLNQPELTAQRFVPNPFSREPGARLYKTGDLARFLPDGAVEFIGRRDYQVKLRGFRIELGEIEAALRDHPSVRDAVVVALEEVSGGKRLIAYVITKPQALPVEKLRSHLGSRLPDYMLPELFIKLPALPVSANGKIDRSKLPSPERFAGEDTFLAPRTSVERKLAAVWRQILGVDEVGIHDNFFELGGDSIHSIQIVSRASQQGIRLTPAHIFQHQTIAELAEAANTVTSIEAEQGVVEGQVPLSPIQKWFFEQVPIDPHHFNQALLLEVDREVQLPALEKSIAQLLSHHDALRLRFYQTDEGWLQIHVPPDTQPVLLHIDLSALTDEQYVEELKATARQLQASLSLTDGPLIRVAFFDPGPEHTGGLLIIIHHLVVDAVSWRILIEDLRTAYQQASLGEEIKLPPKTTSFKQWSETLTNYARSDEIGNEMSYWIEQSHRLGGFALDHDKNTTASAATVRVSLSTGETRLLTQAARSLRVRVDVFLLAALAQAYIDSPAQPSLLIHLEGHGREEIAGGVDLTRTVGWFTSFSPFLLEPLENLSAVEAVRQIGDRLRAIPHRGMGYGLLRYLRGDATINHQLDSLARAEVSFNYLGNLDQALTESSLFRPAQEQYGPTRSARARRPYALDIVASISEGQLRLFLNYSRNLQDTVTSEALAGKLITALRTLAAHFVPEQPQPTLAQAQLWNLDQLLPGTPFFNIYMAISLTGSLNLKVLRMSLVEVVRRHETLRTTFAVEGGRPVLAVASSGEITLPLIDLTMLSGPEQEDELLLLAAQEMHTPFDLAAGPLLRLTLVRLSEKEHCLMLTVHHIIADAWSIGVFVGELAQLYVANCEAQASPLPELTSQYSDYTQWQREWLHTEMAQQQLAYWINKLGGPPTPLNLPTDYPRSSTFSFRTGEVLLALSPELSARLRDFSRREGVSLFMLLLTAFKVLLYNATGKEHIRVGTLAANRNRIETERLIGLFVNTLVICSHLDQELTYRQLLHQVSTTVLEAFDNQELPFEHVMETLGTKLDLEGTPLFDVLFVMQNAPVPSLDLPGLKLGAAHDNDTMFKPGITLTSFDLVLIVAEGPDELSVSIGYKSELFAEGTVRRMLEDFRSVLELMVDKPDQQISACRLSTV